jgi:D-cysteine desulfhydrase
VLTGEPPGTLSGNLVLDQLAGAEIVWALSEHVEHEVERRAQRVREDGGIAYVIPFGGSNPDGVQGYVECGAELLCQLPDLDRVVVAVGSGATMAGLVAHLGAERVIGIDVGAVADPRARVIELLDSVPGGRVRRADLRIDGGQVGAGYATLTLAAADAMRLAARTEGVFLDPTYTARALAGLITCVADGRVQRTHSTVFVHTGGLPGLFGHPALSGSA